MRLSPTVFSIWQSVSGLIATSQIEKERTKGCIVGLWKTEAFYSDLGLVYADETEVIIDEIDDPRFSPYQKSIDKPGIYVFEKKLENRKCLMDLPVAAIQPIKVATNNFEDLVDKINEICRTFRKKDGFLNFKGIHKQNILENLYQFEGPTMDEIKFSRGKNSWKTEGAQIPKCEKRSAKELSYQEFRHSYVERNKPVIITDAVDHWKAFSLWSKKYFLEKLDAAKIHVKLGESGVFEGPEARNLWQDAAENALPEKLTKKLQFPELVMARPGHVQLEISKIFDLFQTNLRHPVEESWTSGKANTINFY